MVFCTHISVPLINIPPFVSCTNYIPPPLHPNVVLYLYPTSQLWTWRPSKVGLDGGGRYWRRGWGKLYRSVYSGSGGHCIGDWGWDWAQMYRGLKTIVYGDMDKYICCCGYRKNVNWHKYPPSSLSLFTYNYTNIYKINILATLHPHLSSSIIAHLSKPPSSPLSHPPSSPTSPRL